MLDIVNGPMLLIGYCDPWASDIPYICNTVYWMSFSWRLRMTSYHLILIGHVDL